MMSKTTVHLPEDFSWYNKETKETIIKSIKEEYGDEVNILPHMPKSIYDLYVKELNQNKDE
jgi:hypothetical protein